MSLLNILIIICFIPVIIMVIPIFYEPLKKNPPKASLHHDPSYCATSNRMMKSLLSGKFLLHTLNSNEDEFKDDVYLESYKTYIRNSSVISFIQSVKGEADYEQIG